MLQRYCSADAYTRAVVLLVKIHQLFLSDSPDSGEGMCVSLPAGGLAATSTTGWVDSSLRSSFSPELLHRMISNNQVARARGRIPLFLLVLLVDAQRHGTNCSHVSFWSIHLYRNSLHTEVLIEPAIECSWTYELFQSLLHDAQAFLVVRTSSPDENTDIVLSEFFLILLHGLDNALECFCYVCEICNASSDNQNLKSLLASVALTRWILTFPLG